MKIKKINNLELRVSKSPYRKYLEIVQWANDFSHCWTIADFTYDEEYYAYRFNSCLDRLNDKNIDWYDLGCLVNLGYKKLKNERFFEDSEV